MGLFDGFAGAALGGVMGMFGAGQQQSNTLELMQQQLKNTEYINKHKHQWEVQDLRDAGLNPMISALNGQTAIAGSSPQGAAPDIAGSISKFSASKLAEQQSKAVDSSIDLNKSQAEKNRVEAQAAADMVDIARSNSASSTDLNSAVADYNRSMTALNKIDAEYREDFLKAGLKKAQIDNVYIIDMYEAQLDLMYKQGAASIISATASQAHAKAEQIKADVAARLGVSQEQVNYALAHKTDAETKKTAAEMNSIINKDKLFQHENNMMLNNFDSMKALSSGREISENIPVLGSMLKIFK